MAKIARGTESAVPAAVVDPHLREIDDVLEALGSSPHGLETEQARQSLAKYGPNRLRQRKRMSGWQRLLLQFHNPLIYVLLATATVTGLLQHWVDTGVILAVVIINAIVGFIQESKAENAIESLREMLAPTAIVLRDRHKRSIPASELVPGDIVYLQGGDKVPADVRLTHTKNLQIEEAALTGESVASQKHANRLEGNVGLADRANMAFAGTLVTTGTGTGVVAATGDTTQIGQIADMLFEVQGVDTPLIRRLASFSKVITFATLALCVLIFAAGVAAGRDVIIMLEASVAIAVSAIPEGLPAIMTIALAIGVKRMAGRNAVIRRLPAVEALGSATVICTDKTGTLTRNEMTVTHIVCPAGEFTVQGVGYDPAGSILDGSQEAVEPGDIPVLAELIAGGMLCNDATLERRDDQWRISGDPTEASLVVLGGKADLSAETQAGEWPRTDEIPFESEQQFMATLHHNHEGRGVIYVKGAPERVLGFCRSAWGSEAPLDAAQWQAAADQLAATGRRVLALAVRETAAEHTVLEFDDIRGGLTLLGLVGMIDPPRQEAIEAVRLCKAAGIRVKMITGDHVATARAIAGEIGINNSQVLSGGEVDALDAEALERAVEEIDVFARVSPAHKLQFVQALQRHGHVVAMTGDGVNDAPALKQADIGVAMGINGTDVSKEAAEVVVMDDNFASIERAVEEGRTVYDNLKKTILFILPTNGGECLTLMVALLLAMEVLPILPLHILWINLVTTVALAITLAFDPVEAGVMQRPPRDAAEPLIGRALVWKIVYVSVLMAAGTFLLFHYELAAGRSTAVAHGVAVNAIVFFEVFYLFNSRHLTASVLNREGLLGNRIALYGIAAVVVIQMAFTYLPVMNRLFDVGPLDAGMWLRVLGAGVVLMLLVEAEKGVANWLRGPRGGPPAVES